MIVTLTPNPSLDLLFGADRLVWDDANRIPMPRRRAGGQGVNLVRAVRSLAPEARAVAVAPLGGAAGAELEALLAAEAAPLRRVALDGETRVFVGVRERATGRSLLLNPRGPAAPPGLAEALLEAVETALVGRPGGGEVGEAEGAGGGWVVCCGSLLPGLPVDLYARAGRLARARGARFVPDCDGDALAVAVSAGADLLVPNGHEAGRLVGWTVERPDEAARAGRALLDRAPRVVVTLGAAGAVAVEGAAPGAYGASAASGSGSGSGLAPAWWARPELPEAMAEEVAEGSAVGAGDAFLAALLLALDRGEGLADALPGAVAAGTAALLSRGTALVLRTDVERVRPHVRVDRLDPPGG